MCFDVCPKSTTSPQRARYVSNIKAYAKFSEVVDFMKSSSFAYFGISSQSKNRSIHARINLDY
ncbi:MAG TPA: hypothetical protein PLX15_02815 [Candidatus Woesearchaeota archaeon]|nr:hypothetical protein [Candidatus Woesearchaeota archaeon]